MDIDLEWMNFINNNEIPNTQEPIINQENNIANEIPKPSSLYISTKTKILFLSIPIDIYDIFWKIPVVDYNSQEDGVIKKQIKISINNTEESEKIDELLKTHKYCKVHILNKIDNPNGRIKYKDVRKISIGINKKDILYSKIKEKSAFYNCFVITLRIIYENNFREFHIKVFNTGKIEIPGLQNDKMLNIILDNILSIFKIYLNQDIHFKNDKVAENVLINSNFNCGFYINREELFDLLRNKYKINASYDPCSYPGIQCVYYSDNTKNTISYMIFRTGSILIVGKTDEETLYKIYDFIKQLLIDEYYNIAINNDINYNVKKTRKVKKKIILVKI
jgi:TATA-box binding protein (TBP) (component of TFIID and TFIIIB)